MTHTPQEYMLQVAADFRAGRISEAAAIEAVRPYHRNTEMPTCRHGLHTAALGDRDAPQCVLCIALAAPEPPTRYRR